MMGRHQGLDDEPTPRAVTIRLSLLLIGMVVLVAVCVGVYYYAKPYLSLRPIRESAQHWVNHDRPPWMRQTISYPPPDPESNHQPPARDLTQEQLAMLRQELSEQRRVIEALSRRPAPAPTPPPVPAKVSAAPPARKHQPMRFIANDLKQPPADPPNTYELAPGATKLPCVVETAINSDVEGYFTAKIKNHIYDTATGQHVLVPQNSTLLGHGRSSALLYGNELIPTVSLTLALPDGRSVDLGQAPVTDQLGMTGLTGKVDHHWWRLFGAVFVGGALRGGAQAVQTEASGAGAPGQVVSGIAGNANQIAQQRAGRTMDTRPTIIVKSGQLCHVILIKPLSLQAYGDARSPHRPSP